MRSILLSKLITKPYFTMNISTLNFIHRRKIALLYCTGFIDTLLRAAAYTIFFFTLFQGATTFKKGLRHKNGTCQR